jgi:hypothetical protein
VKSAGNVVQRSLAALRIADQGLVFETTYASPFHGPLSSTLASDLVLGTKGTMKRAMASLMDRSFSQFATCWASGRYAAADADRSCVTAPSPCTIL